MGAFSDRVFGVVRHIPRGSVATYGQIACIIGAPRSARYVGHTLRNNPSPGMEQGDIPCHRVVFRDSSMVCSFAFGGPEGQRTMLEFEGVDFDDADRVLMGKC